MAQPASRPAQPTAKSAQQREPVKDALQVTDSTQPKAPATCATSLDVRPALQITSALPAGLVTTTTQETMNAFLALRLVRPAPRPTPAQLAATPFSRRPRLQATSATSAMSSFA